MAFKQKIHKIKFSQETKTLDELHNEKINKFNETNNSIELFKKKNILLRRKLDGEKDNDEKQKIKKKIICNENEIKNLETSYDELDYFEKTKDILMQYFENKDHSSSIPNEIELNKTVEKNDSEHTNKNGEGGGDGGDSRVDRRTEGGVVGIVDGDRAQVRRRSHRANHGDVAGIGLQGEVLRSPHNRRAEDEVATVGIHIQRAGHGCSASAEVGEIAAGGYGRGRNHGSVVEHIEPAVEEERVGGGVANGQRLARGDVEVHLLGDEVAGAEQTQTVSPVEGDQVVGKELPLESHIAG